VILFRELALLLAAINTLSCASIINGRTQTIRVETDPSGVNLVVYPTGDTATTPAEIELRRNAPYTIRIQDPGYTDESVLLSPIMSNWMYGNILIGGLIGMSVDISSGAAFKLIPSEVNIVLERVDESRSPSDTTIP